jgi:hypothetical protein
VEEFGCILLEELKREIRKKGNIYKFIIFLEIKNL